MAHEDGLSLEAKFEIEQKKTAGLEAQLVALAGQLEEKNAALKSTGSDKDKLALEAATLRQDVQKLTADSTVLTQKVTALTAELDQAKAKLGELQTASLSEQVRGIVRKAIVGGVAPAYFDGHDKDTPAWFAKRFVSLEAFTEFVAALPRSVETGAVGSGRENDTDTAALSADAAGVLRKLGLDPKYATVNTAADLPRK